MLITGTAECSASSSTCACGPGADRDRVDHPRQHQRGVARRLAARELQLALAQHQRVAAQLGHADLERDPRARRGLVEHERDAAPLERARRQPVALELERARRASPFSSPAVSSSPVRKCRANACPQLEPLPRARLPARARPLHAALAAARARPSAGPRTSRSTGPCWTSSRACWTASEWDVALLQEAPPRWFAELGRRTRSNGVRVLTSRNWWPALQARLADWNPDLIASGEGGSNQILVRHARPRAGAPPAARWRGGRSSAACSGRASSCPAAGGCAWRTCTRRRGCPARATRRGRSGPRGQPSSCPAPTRSSSAATSTCARRATRRPSRRCASASASASRPLRAPSTTCSCAASQVVEPPRALPPSERELTEPDGLRIRLSDHAPVAAEFVR